MTDSLVPHSKMVNSDALDANYRKLRSLLVELLQLEHADLDFGIYRVMNTRREEILKFIDEDFLPQVRQAIDDYHSSDRQLLERELEEVVRDAKKLGVRPEQSPRVLELKTRLSETDLDPRLLQSQVFSDLYSFFRRYYNEGDFIAQRRYKEGVYSIPYEGEEVKLYWANQDQHYIKTAEYLQHYVFSLGDGRRVRFDVASPTEEDGGIEEGASDRRFVIAQERPVEWTKELLTIRFEYRPEDSHKKQSDLNDDSCKSILNRKDLGDWLPALRSKSPTPESPDRTLLQKHIEMYTARNTSDYFIHHDLEEFLRRELDFYIKNEVVRLDELETEAGERISQRLAKVRTLRALGTQIIQFLAQLENFEKSLWLKKKFVLETQYCLTLDRVPTDLYPEVTQNIAQRKAWIELFAIDDVGPGLDSKGYSEPLTVEFLKANPYLLLDTRHFSREFTARLLSSLKDIDDQLDGILICGENSQALRLLETRFADNVSVVYIDPPFNTAASEILYKNNYKHSSWLCMISERVDIARRLMSDDGIMCVAIDDAEFSALSFYLRAAFGYEAHLGTVAVRTNPHGRAMAAGFSSNHEYAIFVANGGEATVGRLPRGERGKARYPEKDDIGSFTWINFRGTGAHTRRVDRPRLFYPLYVSERGPRIPRLVWKDETKSWRTLDRPESGEIEILPIDDDGNERVWTLGNERARREGPTDLEARTTDKGWQVYRKYRPNQEGALPSTWWDDAKYSATESGTRILKKMFGERENFSYPKSVYLVEDCLRAANCEPHSTVLDFFAGSGTTAHAVINLNRLDQGHRKYILVELQEYFDSVLLPRILKAAYSSEWKDGKPTTRDGVSQFIKYIRLESYEDALNSLVLRKDAHQRTLLDGSQAVRREYFLRYMLNQEARGSATLVDLGMFQKPLQYALTLSQVQRGLQLPVDLVETFNLLLGLRVHSLVTDEGFVTVEGVDSDGNPTLVIWRDIGPGSDERLKDFCKKRGVLDPGVTYSTIYVNGDCTLETHRPEGAVWRVRSIEDEFRRRMFTAQ